MRSRLFKLFWVVVGAALLAYVATRIDVADAVRQAAEIGWGIAVILGLHFVSFLSDAAAWQVTIPSLPFDARRLYALWKVRMAGEALNAVIPAAGLGGEPLKAVLLKRHCGVGYREGVASLILSQTIIVLSLVVFLVIGLLLMLGSATLPRSYDVAAIVGLIAAVLGAVLIVGLQNVRLSAILGPRLARLPFGEKMEETLEHVRDIEERLAAFYTRRRGQFAAAMVLSFIPWLIGIPEIYFAAYFLGHPVSLADAWIAEAAVQLVRTGLSIVPAGIGTQEGAFLVIFSALTGSPTLGVSLALVRRFREIVWVLWGAAIGVTYYFRKAGTD